VNIRDLWEGVHDRNNRRSTVELQHYSEITDRKDYHEARTAAIVQAAVNDEVMQVWLVVAGTPKAVTHVKNCGSHSSIADVLALCEEVQAELVFRLSPLDEDGDGFVARNPGCELVTCVFQIPARSAWARLRRKKEKEGEKGEMK
jgi:hypothetical protein